MSRRTPWFPTRRSALVSATRRRGRGRHLRGGTSLLSQPLAAESLESRALLTVSAALVGSDLQISLGAADDAAYLSYNGTNYIVRGTNISGGGYAAANTAVNSVTVAGTAAASQAFTVAAGVGTVLSDPLSVAASVETTSIVGAVNTTGAVTIGSGAITIAADVTTTEAGLPGGRGAGWQS